MLTDNVNHPSHYTNGSIECIDAIKASMSPEAFSGYMKGNVIKYVWRYELKDNPVEDLEKADWYLKKLKKFEKKKAKKARKVKKSLFGDFEWKKIGTIISGPGIINADYIQTGTFNKTDACANK